MNKTIKTLYFLTKNNTVLVCENNVKEFWEKLPEEIKDVKSYDYYNRKFKVGKKFPLEFNKDYFLQKINY